MNKFFQPNNLLDALKLKKDYSNYILLAGGTDLIVKWNKDVEFNKSIIDLSKIDILKDIELDNNELKIGAMCTFTQLANSEVINDKVRIICDAANEVGSPQIRNRGTIGGNICNNSPAADLIPVLLCLNSIVELSSINKKNEIEIKQISMEDLISYKNNIDPNEILTKIIITVPDKIKKMAFQKIGRRNALAIARLNGACVLTAKNDIIEEINFVLGSATKKPERFKAVEEYLKGKLINENVLQEAGKIAAEYVIKKTGKRSSSAYKLPVVAKFTASLIDNAMKKEIK